MDITVRKDVLDEQTRLALEDGLRIADENPQRWSPDEVRRDARRIAKEWQATILTPGKD